MNTFLRFDSFEEFFHKHSEHIPVQIQTVHTHYLIQVFVHAHLSAKFNKGNIIEI